MAYKGQGYIAWPKVFISLTQVKTLFYIKSSPDYAVWPQISSQIKRLCKIFKFILKIIYK